MPSHAIGQVSPSGFCIAPAAVRLIVADADEFGVGRYHSAAGRRGVHSACASGRTIR